MSLQRKVRIKKLNPKTALQVLIEGQIDPNEYESLTTDISSTAGVDQGESNEYHLQAAIKGTGAAKEDNEIPVPPPQESEEVNYDDIYPRIYPEPRNYIKFSETVEETLGCLYDMTTEDDEYLKTYNEKKSPKEQLSEDDFERIMELFEHTAAEQSPFAAVDNTVIPYETMAMHMLHTPIQKLQAHAKVVYEHWKSLRQAKGKLHPSLKFETHSEQDDLDPYVCFRRREVRQTRKTRQRDVQVADKLKKLRKELEDGRLLVIMSQHRENLKQELLALDKKLFEHRAIFKEKKIRLGIPKTEDEDLLINTKPQPKRKVAEVQPPVRAAQNTQSRVVVRPDGRPAEQDLTLLSEKLDEKWEELRRDVEHKATTHNLWNQHHIDLTDKPLPPVKQEQEQSFRPAKPTFLPTPPSSASEQMELDVEECDNSFGMALSANPELFTGGHQSPLSEEHPTFSFRRRHGRGGRLWVDRRRIDRRDPITRLASPPSDMDIDEARQFDRSKYDQDSDSEDDQVYHIDPYDQRALKFRALIPPPIAPPHRGYYRQLPEGANGPQGRLAPPQASTAAPGQTPAAAQPQPPPQPQPQAQAQSQQPQSAAS
ncbi:Enhancer of polycomb-like protein 1 [Pestalotiopsis sp. 9143b]|nr:Enhancer of polycomb-like protein 1 [Pestalotiopsis sp. 9143b]